MRNSRPGGQDAPGMVRPDEAFNTMLDNVKGSGLMEGAGAGATKAVVGASAFAEDKTWDVENLSRFSNSKHTPMPVMLGNIDLTAAILLWLRYSDMKSRCLRRPNKQRKPERQFFEIWKKRACDQACDQSVSIIFLDQIFHKYGCTPASSGRIQPCNN